MLYERDRDFEAASEAPLSLDDLAEDLLQQMATQWSQLWLNPFTAWIKVLETGAKPWMSATTVPGISSPEPVKQQALVEEEFASAPAAPPSAPADEAEASVSQAA